MTYSSGLQNSSAARRVTGQYLAKNRLGKRARAKLTDDIGTGKVIVEDLTAGQIAALCRVSLSYITQIRNGYEPKASLVDDKAWIVRVVS